MAGKESDHLRYYMRSRSDTRVGITHDRTSELTSNKTYLSRTVGEETQWLGPFQSNELMQTHNFAE